MSSIPRVNFLCSASPWRRLYCVAMTNARRFAARKSLNEHTDKSADRVARSVCAGAARATPEMFLDGLAKGQASRATSSSMRLRTWTTVPKTSALRRDSTARIANDPRWVGSVGRRLNRSTACIVGDVGKWLGNCAQDRRPWLRKNCARGLTILCAFTAQVPCAEVDRRNGNSLGTQARGSR